MRRPDHLFTVRCERALLDAGRRSHAPLAPPPDTSVAETEPRIACGWRRNLVRATNTCRVWDPVQLYSRGRPRPRRTHGTDFVGRCRLPPRTPFERWTTGRECRDRRESADAWSPMAVIARVHRSRGTAVIIAGARSEACLQHPTMREVRANSGAYTVLLLLMHRQNP